VDGLLPGDLQTPRGDFMELELKKPFSVYGMICNVVIWHLRLLSVPVEMLLHINVGERYLGFSGLLAMILMGSYAAYEDSSLLNSLMILIIGRVIVHRIWCIRRRRLGDPPEDTRSAGRTFLTLLPVQIPEAAMKWIEPVVVMVGALVVEVISTPAGDYLMWAGAALLGITFVRANLNYNRLLDTLDARITPELPVEIKPDRIVQSRMAETQLLEA
jgi:hypothetical protein